MLLPSHNPHNSHSYGGQRTERHQPPQRSKPELHRELQQALLHPNYQPILSQLAAEGIELRITFKRVKNINFRLHPQRLNVSAPSLVSHPQLAAAIMARLDWIIKAHRQVMTAQQTAPTPHPNKRQQVMLWGQPLSTEMNEKQRLALYRERLSEVMPSLFAKWEPVVGLRAKEKRIKKMRTRWGSCNTKARRIWLSVYLPAYRIECTEYVIVHELCHLHHANHSREFWSEVKRAMPEYQYWHDMLAGKYHGDNQKNID